MRSSAGMWRPRCATVVMSLPFLTIAVTNAVAEQRRGPSRRSPVRRRGSHTSRRRSRCRARALRGRSRHGSCTRRPSPSPGRRCTASANASAAYGVLRLVRPGRAGVAEPCAGCRRRSRALIAPPTSGVTLKWPSTIPSGVGHVRNDRSACWRCDRSAWSSRRARTAMHCVAQRHHALRRGLQQLPLDRRIIRPRPRRSDPPAGPTTSRPAPPRPSPATTRASPATSIARFASPVAHARSAARTAPPRCDRSRRCTPRCPRPASRPCPTSRRPAGGSNRSPRPDRSLPARCTRSDRSRVPPTSRAIPCGAKIILDHPHIVSRGWDSYVDAPRGTFVRVTPRRARRVAWSRRDAPGRGGPAEPVASNRPGEVRRRLGASDRTDLDAWFAAVANIGPVCGARAATGDRRAEVRRAGRRDREARRPARCDVVTSGSRSPAWRRLDVGSSSSASGWRTRWRIRCRRNAQLNTVKSRHVPTTRCSSGRISWIGVGSKATSTRSISSAERISRSAYRSSGMSMPAAKSGGTRVPGRRDRCRPRPSAAEQAEDPARGANAVSRPGVSYAISSGTICHHAPPGVAVPGRRYGRRMFRSLTEVLLPGRVRGVACRAEPVCATCASTLLPAPQPRDTARARRSRGRVRVRGRRARARRARSSTATRAARWRGSPTRWSSGLDPSARVDVVTWAPTTPAAPPGARLRPRRAPRPGRRPARPAARCARCSPDCPVPPRPARAATERRRDRGSGPGPARPAGGCCWSTTS